MKQSLQFTILIVLSVLIACSPNALPNQSIKIGAILPLSGANAVYGAEIQNAIELAKDEINSKGGINEHLLEVVYEDDQTDPKVGVTAMQKLAEVDKVSVVLGPWASGVAVAAAPVAERNKVIMLCEAIAPSISSAGDFIFRIQPPVKDYAEAAAKYARSLNIKNASIIFINNEFGVALKDEFGRFFLQYGGTIVAQEEYEANAQDYRTPLMKIKEKSPEVVFVAGYQELVSVIKQIDELRMDVKVFTGPPFESQRIVEALGPLAEGVVYSYHFAADEANPRNVDYRNNYFARFGKQTQVFGPLMYDGMYIVANAMKVCGEDSSCIRDELYKTSYDGVVGTTTFDKNGDSKSAVFMKTVKEGRFVRISPNVQKN